MPVYSLGDVPQVPGVVEHQHAVVDGDVVKCGLLLVAEERVRDPDALPHVALHLDLLQLLVVRRVPQARVAPLLTQVEAHRVVLQPANTHCKVPSSKGMARKGGATALWDPMDASTPTLEIVGTKCIWCPPTFMTTDVIFCWARRLITDVRHRSCQNAGQPCIKKLKP